MQAVEPLSAAIVTAQIAAVLSDIEIDAVKIGMLGTVDVTLAVAEALAPFAGPIVLDPVMVAKSGDPLLAGDAEVALRDRLLPMAHLLTPNLPEAARLLRRPPARSPEQAERQGRALRDLGADAVLMKGGHADGSTCTDLLVAATETRRFDAARIDTPNTHGTGCSYSSAIASCLARGLPLALAVATSHAWLQDAIAAADSLEVGKGHGPVHHFHGLWP